MPDEKITDMTEMTDPAAEDLLEIVNDPGGSPDNLKITLETLGFAVMHVRQEETTGTGAGGSSNTTWNPIDLNTEVLNQLTGASLGSSRVTLANGTYIWETFGFGFKSDKYRYQLYNITDAAVEEYGVSGGHSNNSDNSSDAGHFRVRFTVTGGPKVFELRLYTDVAKASDGLGTPTGDGSTEYYHDTWIRRAL